MKHMTSLLVHIAILTGIIICVKATNQTYDFTTDQHNNAQIILQSTTTYNLCEQEQITLAYQKSIDTFGHIQRITESQPSPLYTNDLSITSINLLEHLTSHSIIPIELPLQSVTSLYGNTISCVPSVRVVPADYDRTGAMWLTNPLLIDSRDHPTQALGASFSFRVSQQSRTCVTTQTILQSNNASSLQSIICDDQFSLTDRVFNVSVEDSLNQPKDVAVGGEMLAIVLSGNRQSISDISSYNALNNSIIIELSATKGIAAWLVDAQRCRLSDYYSFSSPAARDLYQHVLRDDHVHLISVVIYPFIRDDLMTTFAWNGELKPATISRMLQHPISSCCVYFDVEATNSAIPLFCIPISLPNVLQLHDNQLFVGVVAFTSSDKYQQVDVFSAQFWDAQV